MPYKLAEYHGDTLAVPQLVVSHLTQTDGDTIRAALYLLQTGDTDPRTMARALGMTVTAEGVEDADQVEFLAKAGCQEIQGYYIGKPVTAEGFDRLLRAHLSVVDAGVRAALG